MNAASLFKVIMDVIRSVPLDPTSTVCAIALLVVAALTWRHIIVRDERPGRPARTRRPLRRALPPPTPPPRTTPAKLPAVRRAATRGCPGRPS